MKKPKSKKSADNKKGTSIPVKWGKIGSTWGRKIKIKWITS